MNNEGEEFKEETRASRAPKNDVDQTILILVSNKLIVLFQCIACVPIRYAW